MKITKLAIMFQNQNTQKLPILFLVKLKFIEASIIEYKVTAVNDRNK